MYQFYIDSVSMMKKLFKGVRQISNSTNDDWLSYTQSGTNYYQRYTLSTEVF